MPTPTFRSWVSKLFSRPRHRISKGKPRQQLRAERLEDRTTPAAVQAGLLDTSYGVVFSADFNDYTNGIQDHTQPGSGLELSFNGTAPGWDNSGFHAVHAVNQGSGDFALTFYDNNAITLASGVSANNSGQTYTVTFDAGPSVYVDMNQATQTGDGLVIDVLRSDGSVLASDTVLPGAWATGPNAQDLSAYSFTYTGDGSGTVRLRVATNTVGQNRFGGAIDNLTVGTPGYTDTTFRGNRNTFDTPAALLQAADGKTLVVGSSGGNPLSALSVTRYNADGTPDTTFGDNGFVAHTQFQGVAGATLDADGKILAVVPGRQIVRLNSDGSLDTSFGGDGSIDFDSSQSLANSWDAQVTVQADGKIVVVGSGPYGNGWVVARYNVDGTPDTTFGTGGRVATPFSGQNGVDSVTAIAIQTDGAIVVGGGTYSSSTPELGRMFTLARYDSAGVLDATFGTGGIVAVDTGWVSSIAALADGKIAVGGILGSYSLGHTVVMRFSADGTPDATFDGDGIAELVAVGNAPLVTALTPLADGKLVAGTAGVYFGAPGLSIWQFEANGSPDTSFGGGDGHAEVTTGDGFASPLALLVQPDGRIVTGGGGVNPATPTANRDFTVARLNADGSLDTGFGTGGLTYTDGVFRDVQFNVTPVDTVTQSDGKTISVGVVNGYNAVGYNGLAMDRLNADGSLDTSFGTGGRVIETFGDRWVDVTSAALQADGKILVAGTDGRGASFFVARFNSDGSLDTTFDGDGWAATPIPNSLSSPFDPSAAYDLAVQPDGRIVAVGAAGTDPRGGWDVAVVRYNADGSLDAGFGTGGIVTRDLGGGISYPREEAIRHVAILPDGKIVGTGYSSYSTGVGSFLIRFNADGSPDTSFDGDGVRGGLGTFAYSLTTQADGKILLGGWDTTNGNSAAGRYNADGSPDTGFGTGGTVNLPNVLGYARDLAVQADGKIVVLQQAGLARLNADGSADASFGSGAYGPGTQGGVGNAISLTLYDGYSLVGGSGPNFAMRVTRYTRDPNAAPTANAGGPYVVNEDSPVTFNGSGSADDSGIVSYEWDLDYDGATFTADLTTANPTIAYTFGDDTTRTVALRVTDAAGLRSIATASLQVNNADPTATNNSYSTPQATALTGNVLTDGTADSDPSGANDPLTVTAVNGVAANVGQTINTGNGMLRVNADGSFTFQPETLFTGTLSFTYTIGDGDGGSAPATVTVTVTPAAAGTVQTVTDPLTGGTALLIVGTSGDDVINIERGATDETLKVELNQLRFTVPVPSGRIIVLAGDGNDDVRVAANVSNSARLDGGAGNDKLRDGGGPGVLLGGIGRDELRAGKAGDWLDGGDGDDVLFSGEGNDSLFGGAGNDDLRAGIGNDSADGGDGNDIVRGGDGNDTLTGGEGDDEIYGGVGDDLITDLSGNNEIHAGTGNDTVTTGSGNDLIWTDGGNDLIDAGNGTNEVHAGNGNNVIRAGTGDDRIWSGDGNDDIDAGDGDNEVRAGAGDDIVRTGTGSDVIHAGAGNDMVWAGAGNDSIQGGAGNDILVGGDGNDTLVGDAGRDVLIGGLGADRLIGNADEDILIAGYTLYDNILPALFGILTEWTSSATYAQRMANVTAGTGLTGGYRLVGDDGASQTVFNDNDVDTVTGSQGQDWFFANRYADNGGVLDLVTDLSNIENWTDTDF